MHFYSIVWRCSVLLKEVIIIMLSCNCGKTVSLSMLKYRSCVTVLWKKMGPSTPLHKRPTQTVTLWLIQLSFYRYMGIFCWIVDTVVPIYSTWKFKMSFAGPRNFINDCLSSFRTTLQNYKRWSGSSSNNPWSNRDPYIFKPKRCLRWVKDLREMPNSIEALCFDILGLFVNAQLTNISFS
jgi:hypothetical protein